MKKIMKSFTVYKFYIFLACAFIANGIMLSATYMQNSIWVGTVKTNDKLAVMHTVQFKDSLDIEWTNYTNNFNAEDYDTKFFNYRFELQAPNGNMLFNDEMTPQSSLHRYFALDEHCTLIFLNPFKKTVHNMSIGCLY